MISSRYFPFALMFTAAAAAILAYLQALNFPFVIDDTTYISTNNKLAELPFTELWRLFLEPFNSMSEFLPLRELSYWIDIALFGLNPAAFRIHSIIFYLLCLPVVYGATKSTLSFFRKKTLEDDVWIAAVVTTLFALHPSHAEAVVWIAGRKDVMSGMFALMAFWLAVNARRESGISMLYASATLVAITMAMLSKATAIAVVPLIAVLWFMFWRDTPALHRKYATLLWPIGSILLALGIVLVFAASYPYTMPLYFGMEAITRTLAVLGWFARLAVSPESRHFFYPVFEYNYLWILVTLGAITLAAALASSIKLLWLRSYSIEAFALMAFVILCLPSLQLIPYAPPSMISDRFIFLASWPGILLLVLLLWRLKPAFRVLMLMAVTLLWGAQTFQRPMDWISNEKMIAVDMEAFPGYYAPVAYMVTTQLKKGVSLDASNSTKLIRDPLVRNVLLGLIGLDYIIRVKVMGTGDPFIAEDGFNKLTAVLKTRPEQTKWNAPMSQLWDTCRARLMDQWIFLIKQFPGDMMLRYKAGLSVLSLEHYAGAAEFLRVATESHRLPDDVRGDAYLNYGRALMKKGDLDGAEDAFQNAIAQYPPENRAYCLLADLYRKTGNLQQASETDSDCRLHGG